MRFGLDRMRRMMTVLGSPQRRYDTIHVVGTNGKTSTTRMIAAILQRHGMRTAAYTSPHLTSYRERLQLGEQDLRADAFAGAVERAAWAAERVNRTLAGDDHVTQFELLTAAALWEIAEQEAQVAAIEAGLGGRYDATSVIESRVTALTNVGLEHTRWLGPTLHDIAEEKLAVVRPGDDARARRRAGARGACGRRARGRRARRAHRRRAGELAGRVAARQRRVPAAKLRARARRRGDLPARGRRAAARAGDARRRRPRRRSLDACRSCAAIR